MPVDVNQAFLATRLLVWAYRRGLARDEVDWSDVDRAATIAAAAIGEDLSEPLPEDLEEMPAAEDLAS